MDKIIEKIIEIAHDCAFDYAAPMDITTLKFLPEVREMCAADKCHSYARNWTCPPACGDISTILDKVTTYKYGVLVQTVGSLEDSFDFESMTDTLEKHRSQFEMMITRLRPDHPDMLPMSAGACTKCESCTYPGEPCRFPELAYPSMEAYGLWVSQVCTDNNTAYNYGPLTVSYTSCFLLR